MNNKISLKCAAVFVAVLPQMASAQAQWSAGYWSDCCGAATTASIEWDGLTHIIHWTIQPNTDGTIQFLCGTGACTQAQFNSYAAAVVSGAHAHGVKAILGLTPWGDWNGATSSGTVSAFVSNLVSAVNTYGYDGVDMDWEISVNYTQWGKLLSSLRTALGSKLMTVTSADANISFWVSNASLIDHFGLQTYDEVGAAPYSWFNSALYSDSNNQEYSVKYESDKFLNAGFPRSKLMIGLAFYGYTWSGNSGPRTSGGSFSQIEYYNIVSRYNIASPNYDGVARAPWAPISGGWVTFDNAQSLTEKINYAKNNSLGGWIIWNLGTDYIGSQNPPHPLLHAVALAMVPGGSPPTISSFVANPATLIAGQSSTLSWSTSGATSVTINQGVGTVTGQTSTVVSPAVATTYTLTATNPTGSVTRSATVTVSSNSAPPTISSFAANPAIIGSGASTTLSWTTAGATSLSINQGIGIVTNTTSKAVTPPGTMTYTLTASNANGSATMPVTVTVSSSPLAYWKFDDGSGATAADSSGKGHIMTLFNAPSWLTASCAVNDCLNFNGANQYGSSSLNLSGTNVITVAFWLKWTAYANDNRIALEFTPNFNNASTGFLVLPDESVSGQFQAGVQGNAGYNQVNFPRPSVGVWHHYAFIMNKGASAATQVIPYVDGQAIGYTKPTTAANTNNFGNDSLFAMSRDGTSLFGSGSLDELYIFPRALSAAEILALAGAPSSPVITTTSPLPAGTVGLPYSQTLSSSGSSPITWTVTSGGLPGGLSLNASSGVISGTTNKAGAFSFIVEAKNPEGSDSQQFSVTVNPTSVALTYDVSDLNWTSATIGWGAIHKNASVLGNVLTLNGVTYTEGLGTHADSQIVYQISGDCNTFQSDVGIDDEVGSSGLVDFQVFGDGVKLYDSGLMTGSSVTQKISVSVAGRNQLRLIVNHGGPNINFDHADWANPILACSSAPPAAN